MKTKIFPIKRNIFIKKIKRKEILEKKENLENKIEEKRENTEKESEKNFDSEDINNKDLEDNEKFNFIESENNEFIQGFQLENLIISVSDNPEKNKEEKENSNNKNSTKNLEESFSETQIKRDIKEDSEILYSPEVKDKEYISNPKELKIDPFDKKFNPVSKIELNDKSYNLDKQEEKRYSIEKPDFIINSFNPERDELRENYLLFKKNKKFNIW
ncbi:hypothetical protein GYA25_03560 [Candidatus Woesearchaeota archaeon]|jgi:hypothetical protein|nr:hypothetical protein [Candidatus Woesearchaeota archaeon]